VGFYRFTATGEREYLVLPEAFKREVCAGFDPKFAVKALIDAGWLTPGNVGKSSQTRRIPGHRDTVRCYVFNTRMFEDATAD